MNNNADPHTIETSNKYAIFETFDLYMNTDFRWDIFMMRLNLAVCIEILSHVLLE